MLFKVSVCERVKKKGKRVSASGKLQPTWSFKYYKKKRKCEPMTEGCDWNLGSTGSNPSTVIMWPSMAQMGQRQFTKFEKLALTAAFLSSKIKMRILHKFM